MACPHCQLASRGSAGRARASWSSLLDPRERRAGRRSRCTTECRYSDLSPDRRRRCRGCGRSFAGQRQSARDARSASGCHRGGVGWSACSRCGHLVRLKINVFVVDSQHDCLLLRHAVVASRAGHPEARPYQPASFLDRRIASISLPSCTPTLPRPVSALSHAPLAPAPAPPATHSAPSPSGLSNGVLS